jgi:leucyl/phenylalanyl-tRNA--protein transferase
LLRLCFDEFLAPDYALPDPERAFVQPPGLAGIVHDLTLPKLLAAYRRGLYPFAHIAPLKWWSPPRRSVLFFNELHIAKRLRRQMRQGNYTVTFDRDFEGVIAACAGHRQGRWHLTWITPRIMYVYAQLFDAGYAHSFEVWNERGELAGGGYGVAIGGAFVTESQFSREPNTSKIGFTVLNWHLAHWGFAFNDGKLKTPTCHDMGFREIPRSEFLRRLARAGSLPDKTGRWHVEADLATVADWQPG